MAKKGVGLDSAATRALSEAQLPFAVHQFDVDTTHDVEEDGLPSDAFENPDRVFRTQLVKSPTGSVCVLVPITRVIDYPLVAAALGVEEVKKASAKRILRQTGYSAEELTPLGLKAHLPTLIDLRALDFQTILISAGQASYVIELAPNDLIEATSARTAPLARRL